MAVSFSGMPHPSSVFAAYASISAFFMLVQTMLNQLLPHQVRHYIFDTIQRYLHQRPDRATVVIEERDGMSWNEVYDAAETYLCTKIRPNIERLKISKRCDDSALSVTFAQSEIIPDRFEDMELEWKFLNAECRPSKVGNYNGEGNFHESEQRHFELCFDKRHKERILTAYVPYVMATAKSIADEKKVVKLHTLSSAASYSTCVWDSVILHHPSTFDTLAMEPELKTAIVDDLDRFLRRKDLYRKVGRAWKRGYLLYGPPGTGKSSLIAAMANYLKFDIYDLELTNVKRDSDLRRLLLRTGNRSILVIEDIDCSVELPDRNGKGPADPAAEGHGLPPRPRDQQFTLSGLLNFIDGLWSSCGNERIIIFTTNNKDKLDPALLRPGRMDMHVHMSYLTPDAFNLLASTYLDHLPNHHPTLSEIRAMIANISVTPAEVAEELMKVDDADVALRGVLDFLRNKKVKIEDERDKRVEVGGKEVTRVGYGECNGEVLKH